MKALYFDGQNLTLINNHTIKEDEIRVKVRYAGICGTDIEILKGYMSYVGVLGHEFVGTIESKDKHLDGHRVSGEINVGCNQCDFCKKELERHCPNRTVLGILGRDGAFSEYLSLPKRNLHFIPDSISDEDAVFIEPLAAAFEILEQVDVKPENKIAIVGDGRLANLIAQVLKTKSKNITCFGHHQKKIEKIKKLGLNGQIGINPNDIRIFDIVIEASGSKSGYEDAMNLVKPRGILILKSTIASKSGVDLTPSVIHEVTIVGSRCGVFKPAIDALASGIIKVNDLIDSKYPLERFGDAFEHSQKKDTMKILFEP